MQSIETRFIGPTNFRGARIRVRCQARTMFVYWDHAKGVEGNHNAAACELASKLGWGGRWFGGESADGRGNVYLIANDNSCAFEVEGQ